MDDLLLVLVIGVPGWLCFNGFFDGPDGTSRYRGGFSSGPGRTTILTIAPWFSLVMTAGQALSDIRTCRRRSLCLSCGFSSTVKAIRS